MLLDSEQRLNLDYDYQSTATYHVRGNRMPLRVSGSITNADQYQIKGKWQIGNRKVLRPELDYLLAFFRARGNAQRFRLKDWGDFSTTHNGSIHHGRLGGGFGNGVLTQFQLIKRYEPNGDPQDRIIIKPVAGTLAIYVNSALQASGWTLNTATGIVTFAAAPADAASLRASFEFDVRVKHSDDFSSTFIFWNVADGASVHQLPSLSVEEV